MLAALTPLEIAHMTTRFEEPSPSTARTAAPPARLIPVSDWQKYHLWPPAGGLRHLIFCAQSNGFDQVIRRVGRRVLIDEQAFFSWVMTQGAKK